MKRSIDCALSIGREAACLVAALLAGCAGSQPPLGAPGAAPQSRTIARANTPVHRDGAASAYRVLYSFGRTNDGARPDAALLDVNGVLYGTTYWGGAYGRGTVFSVSLAGAERVLHNFGGANDGASPNASLIDVDGTMYGTTYYGGRFDSGTVFSITPFGLEHVVHSFASDGIDGGSPKASMIDVNGALYGTTGVGGKFNWGTVFSITMPDAERLRGTFNGFSGGIPEASLIDVKGTLYGTTAYGGEFGSASGGGGTVFSITSHGAVAVLHSFGNGSDGRNPVASLIALKGVLYGTTVTGGEYGSSGGGGTVFSISADGAEHVLHSFGGRQDGAKPSASLVAVNGTLYGTTSAGDTHDNGTVFSITRDGRERVLHRFASRLDGTQPAAGMIDVNGTLYGTTYSGGAYGSGTVFALRVAD